MNARIVGPIVILIALLAPASASADPGNSRLAVLERTSDQAVRVTGDDRGGLWVVRSDGVHHRVTAEGAESGALVPSAYGHLASDPTTGDLIAGDREHIVRVTMAGVRTIVADVDEDITSIDVARDGTIYFSAGPHDIDRVEPDGTTTVVVPTPVYVEALTVAGDGSLIYASGGVLYRRSPAGVTTRLSGLESCGEADPCGDNGPATSAHVSSVVALDTDAAGDVFIGELYGRVRAIVGGVMRPVAGAWTRCMYSEIGCAEEEIGPLALLDNVVSLTIEVNNVYIVDQRPDGRGGRLMRVGDAPHPAPWTHQGYRMIARDGGVFTFGWSPFRGSTGDIELNQPIVAAVSNGPRGYWFVAADGGVFTFGDAEFFGSAVGRTTSPVVDMARTPTGKGYWLIERDGRVHAFGDAPHRGDAALPTSARVAAIIGARSGNGYRIVRTDGTQEDRQDQIGGQPVDLPTLNAPIVHARPTPSGNGLWLVAADGGVFCQGDAAFFGSTGDQRLNEPIVDLVSEPTGRGYWLIARDGGVFTFGIARFMGSMGAVRLNQPVVAGTSGPIASG